MKTREAAEGTLVISDLLQELLCISSPVELRERLREKLPTLTLAERFDLLHRLGVYHHSESASGAASSLRETAALRAELPSLIEQWHISSILDIPSGDFYWLSRVALNVDYIGADIVPEIVLANQLRHHSVTRRFITCDATIDPLPRVDLILCRDLLIHLSNRDCAAVLGNFAASKAQFLLTNHFGSRLENADILSGDFRPINLCMPPFSLPPPMVIIDEHSELADGMFKDRAMALWRISDLGHPIAEE